MKNRLTSYQAVKLDGWISKQNPGSDHLQSEMGDVKADGRGERGEGRVKADGRWERGEGRVKADGRWETSPAGR
jgi:hypothetical protein